MSFDYRQQQRQYRELDAVNRRIEQMKKATEEALDNETFEALLGEALELKMDANQLVTSTFAMTNHMADKGKIVFDGIP
ncbi:hypothetical protein ACQRBV_05505 [Pseudomonas sp. R11F]|uniref:Uncharacterized protein n=1 Tax=Pseudomonas palleroniana TaxID=191390 RepID=A0A0X7K639_9PSED|nr:hypothetical protein [Pseudomonas palleroniana]KWU50190.1 hypothetical protein AWV77_13820 [Pseudomonas palleroniana]UOP08404.1 hypothetical protein LDL65_14915 [Pseudomonas palleroniana]